MSRRLLLHLVLLLLASLAGCSGNPQEGGEPTRRALPEAPVAARAERQAASRVAPPGAKQILFGDLHVHTTFSPDAFVVSLPVMGGGGIHPPADACDFARYCADLDFWSINDHAEGISPRLWRETVEAVRQCNAVAGDAADPDLVTFLGWEWSQVGSSPDDHFGHKNVVFLDTEPDAVPRRPIAAPRAEMRVPLIPAFARVALPLMHFSQRQRYFDYFEYQKEVMAAEACPEGVDTRELPDDCHEVAASPAELFTKLDEWGFESLVIPHGTSWGLMTPPRTSLAMQLASAQHDPARQRLFEVYSGHGSAEDFRDWESVSLDEKGEPHCPVPRDDFLPCCWQAGEIIRSRCGDAAPEVCEERVRQARQNYVDAGVAGPRTVPGAQVVDWLDCGQCRDCFAPAFSHRPGGSAQATLAFASPVQGDTSRFRFGLIGSSDSHQARSGNGYKEFARQQMTEAPGARGRSQRIMGGDSEPGPESVRVTLQDLPLSQRRYMERGASFLVTGGLVAVHAARRDRASIWEALGRREVYGTSGDRILLWFDLLNAPGGAAPMGSEVVGMGGTPRFRVSAAGAFEQKPGCPEHVTAVLEPERLHELCVDECYHPGDRRRLVTRIEVVRIRPQLRADEPLAPLIEDPWRSFPCPADPAGCTVEFEDPGFRAQGREVLYYVRAVQEPTLAVNAGGLRCVEDESGECVAVQPCYGDDRTPADDDCLSEHEERAWSSPIFLVPGSGRTSS